MKLLFDKNQSYQLEAIQTIVDLFEGQHLNDSDFEFSIDEEGRGSTQFMDAGVGNHLALTEEELLANLIRVQSANQLRPDEISTNLEKLWYKDSIEIDGITESKTVETDFPNYSSEMETGTGKTYVYLRTIYELNKVYGFKKFVIVVPSVAIREGVLKSLQITFDHLQEIYQNQPAEYKVYDSGRLTELGNFAKNTAIQILVINIDSFTKDANVINQVRETGIKPIEFIQKSKPIVIIDEPQNMETEIRKKAISNLHPVFTLRYSATHKNLYNLVYKLDPVKAYDLGLVKQIEVDSVIAKNNNSGTFISVDNIKVAKQSILTRLTIFVNDGKSVQKKQVTAAIGDDLFQLSKSCDMYNEGYVINEIDAEKGYIVFSGGLIVHENQAVGGLTEDILKEMIDATVENHFRKEKELRSKGIKVLSLFFIDRVANYRRYENEDNPEKGKFALWFEESFEKWQNMAEYEGLLKYSPKEVHAGYFSQDKGKLKDSKEGKSTKADDETFKLIMQDKERLLDTATPLRFIFSHSALREGWDNPNVFQICTLNETKSEMKKRQEIGRGLRLCVDQTGARNLERDVNRLTVIANEAYESFSKALQHEIEEDCGVKFEGRIKNTRNRTKVVLKDKWFEDALFLELWDKIKYRTEYTVNYSTQQLIDNCISALKWMPAIEKPVIYREKNAARFIRDGKGNLLELGGELKSSEERIIKNASYEIPDFVAYIQSKTELTRDTITQILLQSRRMGEIFNNPQLFMDTVVRIIRHELDRIKINDIRYEKVKGQEYEMSLFESAEVEQYSENLVAVKNPNKTLYNYIVLDSFNSADKKFAEECDLRDDILFYVKLPQAFRIKTPVGYYHPEWAIIKKENSEGPNVYIIVETKSSELMKIACAIKNFEVLDNVYYKVVGSVNGLSFPA